MFITKMKITLAVALTVGVVATGTGRWIYPAAEAGPALSQVQNQPGKAPPAVKPKPERDPSSDLLEDAKAQRDIEKQRFLAMEQQLRAAQAQLELAKANYEQARATFELAREAFARAAQDPDAPVKEKPRKPIPQGTRPGVEAAPEKPNPQPTTPSAEPQKPKPQPNLPTIEPAPTSPKPGGEHSLTLPGGTQTDLINLATSYSDALRDLQLAKARLKSALVLRGRAVVGIDQVEIESINVQASERKVDLLRAIIDGAQKDADAEVERVQRLYRQGLTAASQVIAAETKVRVLRLILGSAK